MLSTSLVFFTPTVATRYGLGTGEEAREQEAGSKGEEFLPLQEQHLAPLPLLNCGDWGL
ncbi:MAG: hypothetical protein RM347_005960 [Nostoc sp. ChiQUE02]|uniref:hypothetical protein n=1 Tax=Nostoc sp. ChiQUE02 TaxID=3075377 RepID=UPI002AD46758|nr:hypothetical protein [Nostoc sp. ChiQUE02]